MNPGYKNIFSKSSCLTHKEMIDYLSGNLSEDMKRNVEIHIPDCEMCNDELEGLSNLNTLKELPIIVKSINDKIDSYFKEKLIEPSISKTETKNFSIKKLLSIAASIAILVTVAYFINDFVNKTSNNLAQTEMHDVESFKEEKMISSPKLEENKEKEKNISSINEDEKNNTKSLNKELNIEQVVSETVNDNIISEDFDEEEIDELTNNYSNSNETVEIEEEIVVAHSEISSVEIDDKTVSEDKKDEKISFAGTSRGIMKFKNKKKETLDYSNLRRSGLLSYDVKSYNDAVTDFDKYLTSKPNDFEIIYKLGMSYFYLNKYNKAIFRFNKIISNKNIKFFEDAQWYKSTSLLNQDKKEDALILLKQIENANGKYSKKAKNIIAAMNN